MNNFIFSCKSKSTLLVRLFHGTKFVSGGRKGGASAFEVAPRDFSKKQKKRHRKSMEEKAELNKVKDRSPQMQAAQREIMKKNLEDPQLKEMMEDSDDGYKPLITIISLDS